MLIRIKREDGFNDLDILKSLQEKIGLSLEEAKEYLEKYKNY